MPVDGPTMVGAAIVLGLLVNTRSVLDGLDLFSAPMARTDHQ